MRYSLWPRKAAITLVVIGFVSGATFLFAKDISSPTTARPSPLTDAAQLVLEALQAEADGDTQRRAERLRDAVAADPDYAPAHWSNGEVRLGDRWLSIEAATSEMRSAGEVAQYRQLRARMRNTATAHLQMAQWCADAGLKNQERVHLIYAAASLPTRTQAQTIIHKLGLVRHQRTLMPAAQAELLKQEAKKSESAIRQWRPGLTAIHRDLASRDPARQAAGLAQLRAIRDASAVGPLEILFAKSNPATAKLVIQAIAEIPGQASTDALVRHAMFAEDEEARQAAAVALKPRSLFSYVPMLMSALESPVVVEYQSFFVGNQFMHQLNMYQQGPTLDHAFSSAGASSEHVSVTQHPISHAPSQISSTFTPDQTANIDYLRARNEMMANMRREETNQRIAAVLSTATGTGLNAEPPELWSWWFDYNEMYQPPNKPLSQIYYNAVPAVPYTLQVTSISCFPAGTPVQTVTGPMAIEQIRAGECVLSQDPATGELAYKPVLATTVRPSSPLIAIRTAHETIRATRGHPFWVSGVGWQMAKQLQAGQWLHSTSGPVQIESAVQQDQAECFNLVVADLNSYFVGEDQILVHDNNLPQVTTATVPGL
ncbi:MAG TPA: polymorphic toxin-type HINT domain-containing protein, partial [Pirellulales bacterium]|nr:polymorphic toxin-type HINT domain-containing protein [Pirellulales bacterium]